MKISIILGHPTKGSLNHAIADIAKKFFQDLGDEPQCRRITESKGKWLIAHEHHSAPSQVKGE